jgi:hypothetical protein
MSSLEPVLVEIRAMLVTSTSVLKNCLSIRGAATV